MAWEYSIKQEMEKGRKRREKEREGLACLARQSRIISPEPLGRITVGERREEREAKEKRREGREAGKAPEAHASPSFSSSVPTLLDTRPSRTCWLPQARSHLSPQLQF